MIALPTPVTIVHGTGSCGAEMETCIAPFRALFPADEAFYLFLFPNFQIPSHFLWPDADQRLIDLLGQAERRGECAGTMMILGHSGSA